MDVKDSLSIEIDKYISELKFTSEPKELYQPISYMLEEGGKRIRPTVLLMTCHTFDPTKIEDALHCAAAIEVFHNFTLLHDDIMDNADMRRGKPSAYKKWGQNIAILSGDVMIIYAYTLLQKAPAQLLSQILGEFNKMAREVCEGQQFDMNFEKRKEVSIEEYKNMIRLKTAVVFGSAAKIGAMLTGATQRDWEALYQFGIEMGMAFQLQDDYLDTYGTEEVLGKKVGGDIEEGKKTFLVITAFSKADEREKRELTALFSDHKLPLCDKIEAVKEIYNSLDVPRTTVDLINQHLERAKQQLDKLSVNGEQIAPLKELVESLADRNK